MRKAACLMLGLRRQLCPVIASNPSPRDSKPRREELGCFAQSGVELVGGDEPKIVDFTSVWAQRTRVDAADEHGAELVLGADIPIARLVLIVEQAHERRGDTELFVEATAARLLLGFISTRVAATAVRPGQRPESLGMRSLLDDKVQFRRK